MIDETVAGPNREWLVVWTEARAEKKVATRLAECGLEPWLPTTRERHRWSDRWREVVLPLFPGYLFARVDAANLSRLLRIPGVLTVVKDGRQPARLSNDFVLGLKRALDATSVRATDLSEPVTFAPDDEVVVQTGPLAGLRGVIREVRGARQLVVWVAAIGRGAVFTIDSALVVQRPAWRLQPA